MDAGTYGGPIHNNVGVSQESALSALLFIIYLGDMTQDRQSLRDQMQLPKRYIAQPEEEIRTNQLLTYIERKTKPETTATEGDSPAQISTRDPTKQETISRADEIIYADDANMITGKDTAPQLSKKLQNYSTVAINWDKVDIVARKKRTWQTNSGLPRPLIRYKYVPQERH